MTNIKTTIDAKAAFTLSSHGIRPEKLAQDLGRDMPGALSMEVTSPRDGAVETLLEAKTPSGEMLYDWKVNFDLATKTGAIKNFSIYHAANKGLSIGTAAIRNLLRAGHENGDNPAIDKIKLTAELERGAWVWARMGWLPDETSFRRFQKKVQPKLEALEQVLPSVERLGFEAYAMMHTLLDHNVSKKPALIWPLVDSNLSYNINAIEELQQIVRHPRDDERLDLLRGYLQQNRPDQEHIDAAALGKLDKTLRFLRDLDLSGMARDGRINTSLLLFSWEQWEGSLSFDNPDQMNRLNNHMSRFEAKKPAAQNIFIPDKHHSGYGVQS